MDVLAIFEEDVPLGSWSVHAVRVASFEVALVWVCNLDACSLGDDL